MNSDQAALASWAAVQLVPAPTRRSRRWSCRIFAGERGDRARSACENYERENAFGDADVRLLTTLAASMGVALENARLFAETQRLLDETQQRNAELAVINSVQQGLAAQLDFQGIIDLVGDKLREVLHTGDIGIRMYDCGGQPGGLPVRV